MQVEDFQEIILFLKQFNQCANEHVFLYFRPQLQQNFRSFLSIDPLIPWVDVKLGQLLILVKQLSEALTLFCTSLPVEIENILPIKSILFYFLYGMPRTYND